MCKAASLRGHSALCLFSQFSNLTSTCQRSQLGSDLSQLPTIGLAILPHDFSPKCGVVLACKQKDAALG